MYIFAFFCINSVGPYFAKKLKPFCCKSIFEMRLLKKRNKIAFYESLDFSCYSKPISRSRPNRGKTLKIHDPITKALER